MSNDVYTEVTEQSYGSRIKNSLTGILFGLICVIAAAIFLFWNEGRTIKRLRTLEQGQSQLVQLQVNQPINPVNNGKLVYIAGAAMTMETQIDEMFGISSQGISLSRNVQMYQWDEQKDTKTEKDFGGKERTITTYSYHKGWFSSPQNSNNYKQAAEHTNPNMPFRSHTFQANIVKVGELQLVPYLVSQINNDKSLPLDNVKIPEIYKNNSQVINNGIYLGTNPSEPKIGDIKIAYEYVEPGMVSVVAKQNHGMLEVYYMNEGEIQILKTGTHSAKELFKSAKKSNFLLGWGLRFGGWMVMFIGFAMIFAPLSVIASFVPVLGSIIGAGTGFIAFILASVLSLVMIAIGWISYRPIVGYSLLAIAAILILLPILRKKMRR